MSGGWWCACGSPGGGNRQRQRQACAQRGDLVDRGGFGRSPARADAGGNQMRCFVTAEDVKAQEPGAIGGDQPGELAAAGDDDQAGRAGRQEWPDLTTVAGVVQHDQHPLLCQQAAVQASLGIRACRDALRRYAKRIQELAGYLHRCGRGTGRGEAAQVRVPLPVGEPPGHLVCPVQRQCGLAHPLGP